MDRRGFLKTAGAAGVASAWPRVAGADQVAATARSDRDAWIAVMRRLADPVLTNLANGTLRARMPVEQAAGGDRRPVTHLEAIGRLLAGLAPWIDLPADDTGEGRLRAEYAALARRAIARAVDPASPDFLNFTRDRQPLVDAAFLAWASCARRGRFATDLTRRRSATWSPRSNPRGRSCRATTTGCCSRPPWRRG